MDLINSEHIKFLKPLSNWRILDIYSLHEALEEQNYSIHSARKLVSRLIKKGIISSVHEPWAKRNYIYLTPLGQKFVDPDSSGLINLETIYHDIHVTQLGLNLSKLSPVITAVDLEHKIQKNRSLNFAGALIPDAKIMGTLKGKSFVAAIELELHQKDKGRIKSKVEHYWKSGFYNAVFYFFPNETLMLRYRDILKEAFGDDFNKKIFLFVYDVKLKRITNIGLAMNRPQSLFELIEVDSLAPE